MEEYAVLFVDDEQNILNSLKRLLLEEDFRILTANSGKDALSLLEAGERPAVIVSDQRMPGMEGSELLARARTISPDSIRIMLTGYSDIGAAIDAVNRGGISRYITKPWNDEELKLIIRESLKRFALVQENRRLTAELQEKNRLLEEFNAALERKVEERTRELLRRTKELEGRDRIQQHLLTVTPLEETLETVAAVVREVLGLETAAVYLLQEDGTLSRAAAKANEPVRPALGAVLLRALAQKEPLVIKGKPAAAGQADDAVAQLAIVPVLKNEQPLAVIEARKNRGSFAAEDLHAIASFGMQAAVAIGEARLRSSLPAMESDLDEFLSNFKDQPD